MTDYVWVMLNIGNTNPAHTYHPHVSGFRQLSTPTSESQVNIDYNEYKQFIPLQNFYHLSHTVDCLWY